MFKLFSDIEEMEDLIKTEEMEDLIKTTSEFIENREKADAAPKETDNAEKKEIDRIKAIFENPTDSRLSRWREEMNEKYGSRTKEEIYKLIAEGLIENRKKAEAADEKKAAEKKAAEKLARKLAMKERAVALLSYELEEMGMGWNEATSAQMLRASSRISAKMNGMIEMEKKKREEERKKREEERKSMPMCQSPAAYFSPTECTNRSVRQCEARGFNGRCPRFICERHTNRNGARYICGSCHAAAHGE